MELVKSRFPKVGAHLEKASLVPEAYAQKWYEEWYEDFLALLVHKYKY